MKKFRHGNCLTTRCPARSNPSAIPATPLADWTEPQVQSQHPQTLPPAGVCLRNTITNMKGQMFSSHSQIITR